MPEQFVIASPLVSHTESPTVPGNGRAFAAEEPGGRAADTDIFAGQDAISDEHVAVHVVEGQRASESPTVTGNGRAFAAVEPGGSPTVPGNGRALADVEPGELQVHAVEGQGASSASTLDAENAGCRVETIIAKF